MHRTQIYLDEKQVNLAKLYAGQEGIAFSEFVRRGVDLAIEEKQAELRKKHKGKRYGPLDDLVGKFSMGKGIKTTAAIDHNDIYDYVLPWDQPKKKK